MLTIIQYLNTKKIIGSIGDQHAEHAGAVQPGQVPCSGHGLRRHLRLQVAALVHSFAPPNHFHDHFVNKWRKSNNEHSQTIFFDKKPTTNPLDLFRFFLSLSLSLSLSSPSLSLSLSPSLSLSLSLSLSFVSLRSCLSSLFCLFSSLLFASSST